MPNLPRVPNLPQLIISLTPKLIAKGWLTPWAVGSRLTIQPPIPTNHHLRVSHGTCVGSTHMSIHGKLEITCASRPKILPHNQISYTWEGDPKYLGILLSTRKVPRIKRFGSTQTPNLNLLKVREFSLTLALLSSWWFFYHWLNFRRVFGWYPISALWLVLLFYSLGAPIDTCVDDQLTNSFCASLVGAIYGKSSDQQYHHS